MNRRSVVSMSLRASKSTQIAAALVLIGFCTSFDVVLKSWNTPRSLAATASEDDSALLKIGAAPWMSVTAESSCAAFGVPAVSVSVGRPVEYAYSMRALPRSARVRPRNDPALVLTSENPGGMLTGNVADAPATVRLSAAESSIATICAHTSRLHRIE